MLNNSLSMLNKINGTTTPESSSNSPFDDGVQSGQLSSQDFIILMITISTILLLLACVCVVKCICPKGPCFGLNGRDARSSVLPHQGVALSPSSGRREDPPEGYSPPRILSDSIEALPPSSSRPVSAALDPLNNNDYDPPENNLV